MMSRVFEALGGLIDAIGMVGVCGLMVILVFVAVMLNQARGK